MADATSPLIGRCGNELLSGDYMFKHNLRDRFLKEVGCKAHENIPKYADWLEQLVEEKFTSTNSGYTKCQCKVPSIPVVFTQMEKSLVKCTVCGGHFA